MSYFARFLLFFMVLLNGAFFVWQYHQAQTGVKDGPSTMQAAPSPPGNRLMLLSELMTDATGEPASEVAASMDTTGAGKADPRTASLAPVHAPVAAGEKSQFPTEPRATATVPEGGSQCFRLGPIAEIDVAIDHARALTERGLLVRLEASEREVVRDYWVLLEPFPSRAAAGEAAGQLRRDGIEDLAVIQTGEKENAISLGIYRSVKTAQRRLDQLHALDYPAVIQPRVVGRVEFWLGVNGVERGTLDSVLGALSATTPTPIPVHPTSCPAASLNRVGAAQAPRTSI